MAAAPAPAGPGSGLVEIPTGIYRVNLYLGHHRLLGVEDRRVDPLAPLFPVHGAFILVEDGTIDRSPPRQFAGRIEGTYYETEAQMPDRGMPDRGIPVYFQVNHVINERIVKVPEETGVLDPALPPIHSNTGGSSRSRRSYNKRRRSRRNRRSRSKSRHSQ